MISLDKNNANYVVASFTSAVKKLNVLNAEKTKAVLQNAIEENQKPLILDLENIIYIDSSGIGVIVSLFNYAKNRHIPFILCNISEANMVLVKITKLNDVLSIFADKETAIASIKN